MRERNEAILRRMMQDNDAASTENAREASSGDQMRDFGEQGITEAVVTSFENAPDPRLREIMRSLVRHLHDFVRDVSLTQEEWRSAIDYLTRTGQLCTDKRQEFILLSDALGVSMLVDAINHCLPSGATETTVLGPFYVQNPPELPLGFNLGRGLGGEPLLVEGAVRSTNGTPVANAIVDVWHSDGEGYYDVQISGLEGPRLRGRFRTDAHGRFYFWSVMPSSYSIPNDGPVGEMLEATGRHPYRPAHVHFMIEADGHEKLTTHLFVAGDPYLDSDAVFAVKNSLIQEFTLQPPGAAPDGTHIGRSWRKLTCNFALEPRAVQRAA